MRYPEMTFGSCSIYATLHVYHECAKRGWIALTGDARGTFVHRVKGKSLMVYRQLYGGR